MGVGLSTRWSGVQYPVTAAESVFSEVVDGAYQSSDVCLAVKVSKSQQNLILKKQTLLIA